MQAEVLEWRFSASSALFLCCFCPMLQYFISDLHLYDSGNQLVSALAGFLESTAKGADELYILGDLFDAWVGDDAPGEAGRQTADLLADLSRSGTRISLMHGNRDFLLGQDFARKAGARLLSGNQHLISCAGQETLIMHGDTLCTRDREYMQARQWLRDPAFQQDFLAKPLEERHLLAGKARSISLDHTGRSPEEIMDVTPEEVDRVMQEAGVKLLIHGHTHRPGVHAALGGAGRRLVLGDWGSDGWYIRAEAEQVELVSFPVTD